MGTGTLKVPGKTYTNALLVRVHAEESFLSFDCYFWYSADNGGILLQYLIGDGFFIPTFARYTSTLVVTGMIEPEALSKVTFTNPVESNFSMNVKVEAPADLSYTLVNALGEEVFEGSSRVSGETSIAIDFAPYKPGVYYLRLNAGGDEKAMRTIKLVKI